MLSWAADRLEKLSQTVAPPPTEPVSRFVYCVQKNDEASAMGCLAEIDPLYTIVQPTKGTLPLHLACFHGMVRLIRQLMTIPGAAIEVADAMGNTPLHYASMSTEQGNALHIVKMLVSEYNASVVAKNSQGQTPYDVATLNGIRQYLLPLQLQRETQQAIDNGGVGLPPGIDMGGLRINNPAMPPPPIGVMGGGPPPTPPNGGPPHMMWATPSPNMPPSSYPAPVPTTVSPTAPKSGNAPSSGHSYDRSSSAPSSGEHRTYARSGSSSAANLAGAKYRPDGFHSSSSDVSLQKKYGHSSHGTPVAVPPPPSSGNSSVGSAATPAGPNPFAAGMSAFGSSNRYGSSSRARYPVYDPVTGQTSVVASAGGNYSAQQQAAPTFTMFQPGQMTYQQQHVSQQQQQQPPAYQQPSEPQMAPASPFMSPPPFQQQPQQASYQQQPVYQQQPSAYQQPDQFSAYHQPEQPSTYQQPIQLSTYQQQQKPSGYQQPEQPIVYQQPQQPPPQHVPQAVNQAPAWTAPPQQQPSTEQMFSPPALSIPAPFPVSQSTSIATSTGNVSTASAEEIFASPSPCAKQEKIPAMPTAEPAIRTVTEDTLSMSNVPEQQMKPDAATSEVVWPIATSTVEAFAAPTGALIPLEQANSAGATGHGAADFFGSSPHRVESQPPAAAASNGNESEKVQEMQRVLSPTDDLDEVGLDDVPLEEVPLTPAVEPNANGATTMNISTQSSAATPAGVFSSNDLPPPPFSSRQ